MMKRVLGLALGNSDPSQKIENLRENLKSLTAREADVRTEIESAEIQPGKRRRKEVDHWLTNVEVIKSEFQTIVEENQKKGSPSQLIGHVERVTKNVRDLIQQGGFPNGLVLDDHKTRALPFPVTELAGKMFQKNLEKILGWLEMPGPFLFGVHGMGGVGKTTLLKHINNSVLTNRSVAWRVCWVTVSQDCSLYHLQRKIAHSVTGEKDLEEEDVERRAAVLHDIFVKVGKTLLILDDLWESYMLDKVGILSGGNCCKILLSTRSLEVCRSMGCEGFIASVNPLSKNEASELFVDKLQNFEALATDVKQIATLVAEECCGLPLAIITIAVSMRGVYDRPEWLDALEELKNPSGSQHRGENEIISRLKFSYDRLKDEMTKCCFLSCVLYPEDFIIKRIKLIDVWIAEGLLNGEESRHDQLINKGHTILNKLENACLLESTSKWGQRCVKMHDMIRDMGIFITKSHPRFMAKSGLQLTKAPEEELWSRDLVKVSSSYNTIKELPPDMSPRCPNLSVLLLFHNPLKGIPDSFFVHMTKSLTVLDLSETDIVRLPDTISDLENLRGLFLEDCYKLRYVPSLAKLTKLKVLDLTCTLVESPRGMERLNSLEKITFCNWNISDLPSTK